MFGAFGGEGCSSSLSDLTSSSMSSGLDFFFYDCGCWLGYCGFGVCILGGNCDIKFIEGVESVSFYSCLTMILS